ncbi:hypothetical protein [Leisingera aquaemixtae]|uniref:Uncharacterized protein n=1 Tax=Leisingera aquaemixtae TaxID=1396826 RepID=A0A0P1HEL7_9RHOB|nr:hypothetical protein [Leisingera aquaemixtae]CUI01869.1 hypothetical protein PHA8399_04018 [Leisingera aquaemixtae]
MSDPSEAKPGWVRILRVNLRLVSGFLALFFGWICWQMAAAGPEWWGFWIPAALCFLGGVLQLIGALFEVFGLIGSLFRWNHLRRKGVAPRADHQPAQKDLRDGGMIR